MKLKLLVSLIILFHLHAFAKSENRKAFLLNKKQLIDSVFAFEPTETKLKDLKSACWASELIQYKSKNTDTFYRKFFKTYQTYNNHYKYVVWQNIYALFPTDYIDEVKEMLKEETNEKLFSILAYYLFVNKAVISNELQDYIKQQFPDYNKNVHLSALIITLKQEKIPVAAMHNDLIEFCKSHKKSSIILFVSKDRNKVGEAIFINQKGKILKNRNDTLKIKMLARSVTNLPAFLTNGNTPSGVFSINGFNVSDNVFIGKSPMIITRLPFEVSVSDFSFSEYKDSIWSLDAYNRFFPKSWHQYNAKNMAYYAGEAGRSEIIIHGTTIDPDYYKNAEYHPYTPSLGCVCTLEIWNDDGKLLKSDQQKLVNIAKKNNFDNGYFYVVEK